MKTLYKNNALTVGAVKTLKANTINHKKILASSYCTIILGVWQIERNATCHKFLLKEAIN